VLGVRTARPRHLRLVDRRTVDGVEVMRLRYHVGFGPETHAYLLRPDGATGALPGLLGMHAHGGRRWLAAEQLADPGPELDSAYARRRRAEGYDSRAVANDLARAGFAVLVHDTFSWGSRRFDLAAPTAKVTRLLAALDARRVLDGHPPLDEADRFDAASALHEDLLAKTAGLLGTTFAGAVVTDDLAALEVLASADGVDPERLGTWGFSGGGARAHYLGALDARVHAVAVACMMATFDSMVPTRIETHSWLLHSPGLPQVSDWPMLAAIGAAPGGPARRTLVQYGRSDPLFTPVGMAEADRALRRVVGYEGRFYDSGHVFSGEMQQDAARFLRDALEPRLAA
jgi:dienelactone hydrolase